MKKLLAIVIVICMAAALFACGDSSTNTSSTTGTGTGTGSGSVTTTNEDSGAVELEKDETKEWPDEIGFFDPTFDYTTKGPFKVGYLVTATSFLTDEFSKAFADWAARMNINYTGMWAPAGGSVDEYLSGVHTFIDQGYTGLILDSDVNLFSQVTKLCEDNGVGWMGGMSQARENDYYQIGNTVLPGRLLGSNAGFDNTQFGIDMLDKLVEWKEATYPDVPWEKVAVISVDASVSAQLHERTTGAEWRYAQLFPQFGEYHPDNGINPEHFYIADTSSGTVDQVTAQNLVTQYLSDPPGDYEVWLIAAPFDDLAMGAANAAENLGMADITCAVCIGGSALFPQWDNGVDTAWRYAQFTAQAIFAEPLMAGLWAQMAGQATHEELWPDWVKLWDKGDVFVKGEEGERGYPTILFENGKPVVTEEHNFATLWLPTAWLDQDNYRPYLEWTDLYAYGEGAPGHYAYDAITDLNMYNARATNVPASYSTYPVD